MLTTRRYGRAAPPAPAFTAAAFGLTLLVLVIYWSCSGRDGRGLDRAPRARRRAALPLLERVVVSQLLERPFPSPLRIVGGVPGGATVVVRRRALEPYRPHLYPFWFN